MPFFNIFYHWSYLLVIIGSLIVLAASAYMRSTYAKYSQIATRRGVSGQQASEQILRGEGIHDVRLNSIPGVLTDHYNPKDKTLNLSEGSRFGNSIADLGVAAHEAGHAIQDNQNYFPLQIRSFLVPITNIGAKLSWPIILIGIILGFNEVLMNIGIFLFIIVFAFQLVTLPVEFNASSRAIRALESHSFLSQEELAGTRKVLRAAALTYVASAASTLLQLLRLILLTRQGSGRRR